MSSFTALNLSAEDIALDAEEHTRELQIEEAFKIFQKALKFQKDGEFDQANTLYDELFGIDVITNDSHSGSPTIRTLRYLAYRNRGLLHFDELRTEIDALSPLDALENLMDALDDLAEALQHSEGDIIVINLLLSIFNFFGNDRLSRFLIEYGLSKDENDELYLHERSRMLSSSFLFYLTKEKEILEKIGCFTDSKSHNLEAALAISTATNQKLEDLTFLEPIKSTLDVRHSYIEESYEKNITIDKLSWTTIGSKLYQQISRNSIRSHRYKDGYTLQHTPLAPVRFIFPGDETSLNENQQDKNLSVEIFDINSIPQPLEETPVKEEEGHHTPPEQIESTETSQESDSDLEILEHDFRQPIKKEEAITDGNSENKADEKAEDKAEDDKDEGLEDQSTRSSRQNSLKREISDDQQPTQRASKRFRQQAESEPEINRLDEFQTFCANFNHYLANFDLKLCDFSFSGAEPNLEQDELYIKDFYNCLDNWTSRHAEFLSFNSSRGQSGLALSELINTNIINASLSSDVAFKDFSDDLASDFVHSINSSSLHFCEVRSKFMSVFMGSLDGSYPLTDFYLGRELYTSIENLVLASDSIRFDELLHKNDVESTAISVATLEIITNQWIHLRQRAKSKGLSSKAASDLNFKIVQIQGMIQRWRKIVTEKVENLDNEFLSMRMRWISLLYLQHEQKLSVQCLKKLLLDLHVEFQEKHQNLTIQFPNYESVPTLNAKMIKNQSDKLNVLTTFEGTLTADGGKSGKANMLLETVLLGEGSEDFTDEQKSMEDFVCGSSISLQLKLWKILLDSYIGSADISKYQKGLAIVLPLLSGQINGENYNKQPDLQRQQLLLNTIGFYGDYINGFSILLESNSYLVESVDNELFKHILSFMRILLCYIVNDYSNTTKSFHQVAQRSSTKFREITVNTLIVIFCFYDSSLDRKDSVGKYELLSVLHDEIGKHEFCDAASGRFLKLSQQIWKTADADVFESDILQHLNCRFHIPITNDRFTPYDHNTKAMEIDKTSAITFSPCLMNLITKKRDPLFSVLKPDLKSALDAFSKAIGEPNDTCSVIQKNNATINQFLNIDLDKNVFKGVFMGSLDVKLRKTLLDEQVVSDQGLFYSQAVSNLNMYKVRKKAMQAKASDLDAILKIINIDLVYGSDKAEPWLLLGQTFSLQVEDDLIWTSDKLNIPDKKLVTAATQKKSILSFLMCLNVLIRDEIQGKEIRKPVFAMCLSHLSRELFHSLTKPMSGLCFEKQSQRAILKEIGDVSVVRTPSQKCESRQLLMITLHTIQMAIQIDDKDWLNYFYLAQALHKLDKDPQKLIDVTLKACQLNESSVEPHYQLCSYLYKYGKRGLLTPEQAMIYLNKTKSFFGPLEISEFEENRIELIILQALKRISQIDKKKWHHKHRYKLSKIYYDLLEFDKAYEEMESLIILKSTNKNLVSIWKPDLEPPGKHFVYTYSYILYFIKLTNTLADFQKMLLFTKKLRRYGAGMINLNDAWDTSCTTVCLLAKEVIGAEPGFTDIEVPKLIYIEFMQASRILAEQYKKNPLKEDEIGLLTLLYEISEVRRMNNGFGSTSQLDDTFNSIFLKIYFKNVTEDNRAFFISQQSSLNKPSSGVVKTKVARRDILASATSLVRSVESKLREHKITDDKGFIVPEYIKKKHLEEARKSILGSSPVPQQNIIVEPTGSLRSPSNLEIVSTPKAVTPTRETSSRTPEYKGSASGKSNVESDDEFHTPLNSGSFDVDDA